MLVCFRAVGPEKKRNGKVEFFSAKGALHTSLGRSPRNKNKYVGQG